LGALQTYGSLADLLLPGVSTITTRSRYLAMLCRALHNADEYRRLPPGAAGLSERRKAVEPFERLWALACVAAREQGFPGAVDGLRGISYAEKAYQDFTHRGGRVTPDFKMLKYQGRTGGVGTYWTALVGGELVDADSGALMHEGRELAEEFPQPHLPERERARLARPDEARLVKMSADDLAGWAEDCHLSAASADEKSRLHEALTADDRRDTVAQALDGLSRQGGLPDVWDIPSLLRLEKWFSRDARAERLGLPTVVQAVVVTEPFHEAALAVFQALLWWATERAADPIEQLLSDDLFANATECSRGAAAAGVPGVVRPAGGAPGRRRPRLVRFGHRPCDHAPAGPARNGRAAPPRSVGQAGRRDRQTGLVDVRRRRPSPAPVAALSAIRAAAGAGRQAAHPPVPPGAVRGHAPGE